MQTPIWLLPCDMVLHSHPKIAYFCALIYAFSPVSNSLSIAVYLNSLSSRPILQGLSQILAFQGSLDYPVEINLSSWNHNYFLYHVAFTTHCFVV